MTNRGSPIVSTFRDADGIRIRSLIVCLNAHVTTAYKLPVLDGSGDRRISSFGGCSSLRVFHITSIIFKVLKVDVDHGFLTRFKSIKEFSIPNLAGSAIPWQLTF